MLLISYQSDCDHRSTATWVWMSPTELGHLVWLINLQKSSGNRMIIDRVWSVTARTSCDCSLVAFRIDKHLILIWSTMRLKLYCVLNYLWTAKIRTMHYVVTIRSYSLDESTWPDVQLITRRLSWARSKQPSKFSVVIRSDWSYRLDGTFLAECSKSFRNGFGVRRLAFVEE